MSKYNIQKLKCNGIKVTFLENEKLEHIESIC